MVAIGPHASVPSFTLLFGGAFGLARAVAPMSLGRIGILGRLGRFGTARGLATKILGWGEPSNPK